MTVGSSTLELISLIDKRGEAPLDKNIPERADDLYLKKELNQPIPPLERLGIVVTHRAQSCRAEGFLRQKSKRLENCAQQYPRYEITTRFNRRSWVFFLHRGDKLGIVSFDH